MDKTGQDLSVSEAAGKLRVTTKTVRRYIQQGMLQATWGGGWRISSEALDRCREELARRKLETGRIG